MHRVGYRTVKRPVPVFKKKQKIPLLAIYTTPPPPPD